MAVNTESEYLNLMYVNLLISNVSTCIMILELVCAPFWDDFRDII